MEASEFEQLIDALRDPGVYDHPVRKVTVIETHISAVLLAGDYAYKIKKPVDFGFVDFTSLEKRRHYCGEELRLNRRFAPDLYLDVVAVHEERGSPSFRGDGPPIEYAVRMRRFDERTLLDRCINRGDRVTAPMIETFAADVAAVHGAAAVAGPGDGYGTPDVITANVRECRDPIRDAGLIDAGSGLLDDMDRRAEGLKPWFEHRLSAGRVRECHGDLHLGNLFLREGKITAFDCVEFNAALRWIDVANDIAFTTMDLRYHGRHAWARRLRNAYLDASGDYPLLRVLRYYEIYRALVRAKVASLRDAEQPGAGLRDARAHLALADRMTNETPGSALIITCGLSGSGKTYVTTGLLEAVDAVRVRSDVERERSIAEDEERYSEAGIDRVYARLEERVVEIVEAGYPVVVDATFLKRGHRDQFRHLARRLGVPFRILYCQAPETVLRQRIGQRLRAGTDASEADLAVLDLQLGEAELPDDTESDDIVEYDATVQMPQDWLLARLGLEGGA